MLPFSVLAVVGLSFAAPAVAAMALPASPGFQQEDAVKEALAEADLLFKQGKFDLALKAYKAANGKGGGKCADCLLGVAKTYVKLGAHKSAVDECDRLALLVADDKQMLGVTFNLKGLALSAMADVKKDQKKYAEAEAEFRKALDAAPGSPVIHFNIGKTLLARSQDAAGIDELRLYLEKDPKGSFAAAARSLIDNPRRAREAYAPDFSFTTSEQAYISLDDLRGKVIVLDFWGTWCPPCVSAVPDLVRLAKKFAAEPVVIISVSSDSDEGKWRDFIGRNAMTWPQYLDRNRAVQRAYGVDVFPTYVVIDHEGIFRDRLIGGANTADLQDAIKKGLKALAGAAKSPGAPR